MHYLSSTLPKAMFRMNEEWSGYCEGVDLSLVDPQLEKLNELVPPRTHCRYPSAYSSSGQDTSSIDDGQPSFPPDEDGYDQGNLYWQAPAEQPASPHDKADFMQCGARFEEANSLKLENVGYSTFTDHHPMWGGPSDQEVFSHEQFSQPPITVAESWSYSQQHGNHFPPFLPPNVAEQSTTSQSPTPVLSPLDPTASVAATTAAVVKSPAAGSRRQRQTGKEASYRCCFAPYGCESLKFAAKNELKRHVDCQHMQSVVWKCTLCAQGERGSSSNPHAAGAGSGASKKRPGRKPSSRSAVVKPSQKTEKVFLRKDLFNQHVKRMHKDILSDSQQQAKFADKCMMVIRPLPEKSHCVYCGSCFSGEGSWKERMEHVGKHMENGDERKKEIDPDLQRWAINSGVIVEHPTTGKFVLHENHNKKKSQEETWQADY